MAQHRSLFVAGAEKNGLSGTRATLLVRPDGAFAGYGFNKSHAAAYALIAYQTAYFKAHHPAAFMAANLSLVMDDTDKVRQFYVDALALGLEMLPPDVNASSYRFEPVDANQVRYGLGAIKGTGQGAIESIVAARSAGGPFRDLFDFCRRIDRRAVNRRAVEALVKAGAFDAVDSRRASLAATVAAALEHAEQSARAATQVSLFGDALDADGNAGVVLTVVREWSETERLVNERASLGYLSGHPYRAYADELDALVQQPLSSLKPTQTAIRIAGVVGQLRMQTSRRGKMAFVTLDDGKDQAEIVVFNEVFDAHRHLLREDQLLVADVKISQRMNEEGQLQGLRITAEALYDLPTVRRRFARGLRLSCNGSSSAQRLLELLEPHRNGRCPITIHYANCTAGGDLQLGESWNVNLEEHLLASLREGLQPENVRVLY